jgi:hypothetical protein
MYSAKAEHCSRRNEKSVKFLCSGRSPDCLTVIIRGVPVDVLILLIPELICHLSAVRLCEGCSCNPGVVLYPQKPLIIQLVRR